MFSSVIKRKSNLIYITIESCLLAIFSYSIFTYYDLSLDLMNEYPFREVLSFFTSILSFILLMIIAVIWCIQCLRKKEIKAFGIMVLIVLFLGLFILDPFVHLIDQLVSGLFHLVDEDIQNYLLNYVRQIQSWMTSLK